MTAPKPQPGILDIAPYKGGEGSVPGVAKVHKLSSNESPIGPSPKAVAVYQKLAAELHRYPDGGADALRTALAKHYGLPVENIVCSNGSDEMISLICAAYCGPGDEVLYSQHGFLMYAIAAKARGATPVTAPETNYTADVDALLKAVTPKTRIVFLANPNNPTGSYISASELRRLREGLPAGVLLVIDAAYAEYVSRNDYSNGAELVRERDDTIMTRTFSKIYGLAALRLGWTYAPTNIVEVLNRVRGPFNVNSAAQAAGVAALEDVAWLDKARSHNDIELPRVSDALSRLGLHVLPSVGNFLLIRFPGGPEQSKKADDFLRGKGLILRAMGAYGLPESLRLSIGTVEENDLVIAALTEFMAKA
ncbi:histidinol-phosphate transaminase [uncultured Ferrovibrio sp.]|uniref:histidinol-phosphate transaminase n=1 Tax=uncultured Ferrovibrio sp. TaxID=1576913 RepID=UPI002603AA85|nr:histidinol-phosphate transaminase [uncultured Ferrovibrio sp.]